MLGPRRVAWLALMYRVCQHNHHTSVLSHLDDLASCPGEISLAVLEASHVFTEVDWRLVGLLIDQPERILATARTLTVSDDPLRAEALLHAWGHRSSKPWAAPYRGRRWHKIEREMRALEASGLTTSRDEVEALAASAYMAATGTTYEEYLDEYPDAAGREYVDA